jgi:hypothetical protein
MCLGGAGQRQGGVDVNPQTSLTGQGGQRLEGVTVGLDQHKLDRDATFRCGTLQRGKVVRLERQLRSAGLDDRQPILDRLANRVDHHVEV